MKTDSEARDYPLILSPPLVMATLSRNKHQTRRLKGLETINEHPDWWKRAIELCDGTWSFWNPGQSEHLAEFAQQAYPQGGGIRCPYGQAGDVLWVRETTWWPPGETWNHIHYVATPRLAYRRNRTTTEKSENKRPFTTFNTLYHTDRKMVSVLQADGYKKRPSIFMPKKICRLWLEITEIRPERLKDISKKDAIAEGIFWSSAFPEGYTYPGHPYGGGGSGSAWGAFVKLWDKLNRDRGMGSDVNPWVWVISYRVLQAVTGYNYEEALKFRGDHETHGVESYT